MTIKEQAEALGWTDVHGDPEKGGAFWRGINPDTGRVEKITPEILQAQS